MFSPVGCHPSTQGPEALTQFRSDHPTHFYVSFFSQPELAIVFESLFLFRESVLYCNLERLHKIELMTLASNCNQSVMGLILIFSTQD